ncbi:hypothetical protein ACJJIF_21330 [Microbulbifer sp. SSSA002]|uniref:hypothetical protein n=1 Tax=Microbulbifer sp. SSSA002 TaxID=3243376 RepID=UPI004039D96E
MERLIDKFIEWWKFPSVELANEIFHKGLFVQDCGSGNAKDIWLSHGAHANSSDFRKVKSFFKDHEAAVFFECTDIVTGLYYRYSVYLRCSNSQIIEILSTKESVAKE